MDRRSLAVLAMAWFAAGCGEGEVTPLTDPPDTEEPPATFSCTGAVPANATLCPGTDAGLTANAARSVKPSCTCDAGCEPTPCSYACDPGFTATDGLCKPVSDAGSITIRGNGDGTVTVTDGYGTRVWLRDAGCRETVAGIARPGPISWYEADEWAGGLASGACGLADGSSPGDWRLPDENELANLAADLSALGDTGREAFTGIQPHAYWTSFSTCVGIYGVIVIGSGAYSDVLARELHDVWPVRSR